MRHEQRKNRVYGGTISPLRHLNRYLEEAVKGVGGIDPFHITQALLAIDLVKSLGLRSVFVEVRLPGENRQTVAHLDLRRKPVRFVRRIGAGNVALP